MLVHSWATRCMDLRRDTRAHPVASLGSMCSPGSHAAWRRGQYLIDTLEPVVGVHHGPMRTAAGKALACISTQSELSCNCQPCTMRQPASQRCTIVCSMLPSSLQRVNGTQMQRWYSCLHVPTVAAGVEVGAGLLAASIIGGTLINILAGGRVLLVQLQARSALRCMSVRQHAGLHQLGTCTAVPGMSRSRQAACRCSQPDTFAGRRATGRGTRRMLPPQPPGADQLTTGAMPGQLCRLAGGSQRIAWVHAMHGQPRTLSMHAAAQAVATRTSAFWPEPRGTGRTGCRCTVPGPRW